jgi:hypothetical protein
MALDTNDGFNEIKKNITTSQKYNQIISFLRDSIQMTSLYEF